MSLFIFLALTGCREEVTDKVTTEDHVPPEELVLPDLSDINIPQAFEAALERVTTIQLNPAWNGNRSSLSMRYPGCPDVYVGAPEDLDMEFAPGLSWADFCSTTSDLSFDGYVYWDSSITQSGDAEDAAGLTISGSRFMAGQGAVRQNNDLQFRFDGQGSDSLYLVEAPDYRRYIYSALIQGAVAGELSTGNEIGFRADMYLYTTGGDIDSIEARGDVFWFDDMIQERFDSSSMDLVMVGDNGAGPDDCPLEPKGWMGIRDQDANWYDLVFMPQDADDSTGYMDEDRSICDGCGTLYLRGLETQNYGTICPDFTNMWISDIVDLPQASDFMLSFQELEPPGQEDNQ
jgi:hypothetical protein